MGYTGNYEDAQRTHHHTITNDILNEIVVSTNITGEEGSPKPAKKVTRETKVSYTYVHIYVNDGNSTPFSHSGCIFVLSSKDDDDETRSNSDASSSPPTSPSSSTLCIFPRTNSRGQKEWYHYDDGEFEYDPDDPFNKNRKMTVSWLLLCFVF